MPDYFNIPPGYDPDGEFVGYTEPAPSNRSLAAKERMSRYTPAQLSERASAMAKARYAKMTPEELSKLGTKLALARHARQTPEERSKAASRIAKLPRKK